MHRERVATAITQVLRVFVASMWDRPYREHADPTNHALFDRERESFLHDLRELPRHSRVRRLNEVLKRWRSVRTHAMLCSLLVNQFGLIGREKKQAQLLDGLDSMYTGLAKKHGLNAADFQAVSKFRRTVEGLGIKMWQWQPASDDELATLDRRINEGVRSILDAANAEPAEQTAD